MGLQTQPGQLQRFVGLFYKVNSKRPPSRPQQIPNTVIERLVLSKGNLMILTDNTSMHATVDPIDQVDDETYQSMLQVLTDQVAEMMQVFHLKGDIRASLEKGGIAMYYDGMTLRVHPLTEGTGEIAS